MHRTPRLAVAICLVALTVGLGYRWWSTLPEIEPTVAAPVPPAPPVVVRPMPPDPLVSTPLPASRPMVNPALAKGFATSTNYREFIAFAKTDVEHGGGAYASAAQ
jgi:hypothetical protein